LPITTVDDYAESILEQKLSQVPGVGLVTIGGMQHPAVRVQFNPAQLAANGLDLEDVRNALANVSVDQPKGSLYGATRSNTLQTDDQILTPADWDNQIIAYRNGGPIRVSDVGKAVIGPQDETLKGWDNLHLGVIIAVQRLPGANVISTVRRSTCAAHSGVDPAVIRSGDLDRDDHSTRSDAVHLILRSTVVVDSRVPARVWATLIPAVASVSSSARSA
jgi:HAE1 family hydrophobic/amphiphilic exporter-1